MKKILCLLGALALFLGCATQKTLDKEKVKSNAQRSFQQMDQEQNSK